MPHCILEYSENIEIDQLVPDFLRALHATMMESGVFELAKIKSRAVKHDRFRIGEGTAQDGFVHLEIKMFEGRTEEVRKSILHNSITLMRDTFQSKIGKQRCSVTAHITEWKRSAHISIKDLK